MIPRILVVEDEQEIAKILKIELEYEGYEVLMAHDGKLGLQLALTEKLDLILLDVMLPEINGLELLRKLRKENHLLPIILLTARNMTMDKVTGLDLGANDYITKPFEMDELLARVRSCLRQNSIVTKTAKLEDSVLSVRDLIINLDTREVTRGTISIPLTPKEYDLLCIYFLIKIELLRERIFLFMSGVMNMKEKPMSLMFI